jgi:putative PEP-CTERM system TPR-repeat lipoprotein
MKNEGAAADDLKRAVIAQPDFIPARVGQLELAVRRGKTGEAMAMSRELQKRDAGSPLGFSIEGDLHFMAKKPALALPAYEKAFSLAPSPETLIKLADTMKLTGKAKEAEIRLSNWRQAHPADPMIPLYLSQQYMGSKQYKPAAEALRVVLGLRPDNVVALNNLAWVYQQDKDPRALEIAERAAAVAPDSPAVLDTLGWLLVEQGNLGRGLTLLQKGVDLAPASRDLRYHLALALHKSGDKARARKELEQLLSESTPFSQAEEAKALLKTL